MLRRICHGKIHGATITEARLDYVGSIQIDETLMHAAGMVEHEMVYVANMSTGDRFETYIIKGPRDSGVIGLNGAAARLGLVGDKLIVFSMGLYDDKEAASVKTRFVYVDAKNRVDKVI